MVPGFRYTTNLSLFVPLDIVIVHPESGGNLMLLAVVMSAWARQIFRGGLFDVLVV